MKVSEIPYQRYTIEQGRAAFEAFKKAVSHARSAEEAAAARAVIIGLLTDYSTAVSLANCRFTLDTRDEFYQAEMAYYDETGPLFSQLLTEYADIMLTTPYRSELEKLINPRCYRFYEIAKKAFNEIIIPDMQQENAVVTEYSKFMSELTFDFRGEKMPLSVIRGKLEDTDREVRREAACAIGRGLAAVGDRLDDFFDRLVRIRDTMAKKMGCKNYIELGYYLRNRIDYDADAVAKFRSNVEKFLVPCVEKLKEGVAAELGIEKIMYYDDSVYSKGEVPKPRCGKDGIFAGARIMYDEMDSEIGAFMRDMLAAEAFDVDSRDGKWGGGYCTCFPKYKQPFILANFNGTSGDIDVITHEFGHAFAARNVFEYGDIELDVGGMETAECHSMSMEFLCWRGMDKFFDKPNKYRYSHLCAALSFIPYGVIVDEFQHIVYEHPEYTSEQRKAAYLALERKYRPYMSFDGIPYLEQGTRWQYQMHIYESPFYYIDYCLAQTVALWFLKLSREDYALALTRYKDLSKSGGTKAFGELTEAAGIPSPFDEGSLKALADECIKIAEDLKKSIGGAE